MLYLFDIDGTLMRAAGAGMRALRLAFAEIHGISDATLGVDPNGMTDPLIVAEMFRNHMGREPDPNEIEALLRAYEARLANELAQTQGAGLLPGVLEVLDVIERRQEPVGLCTGNTFVGARIKLEHVGIWRRFPFGGFGSDAAARPTVVRTAIARAEAHMGRHLQAEEILVVGDTPRDIAAARAVGVRVAAVATGPHTLEALSKHHPDMLFPTLREMAVALEKGA